MTSKNNIILIIISFTFCILPIQLFSQTALTDGNNIIASNVSKKSKYNIDPDEFRKKQYSHNSTPEGFIEIKNMIESKLKFGFDRTYCDKLLRDEFKKNADKIKFFKPKSNIYVFYSKNANQAPIYQFDFDKYSGITKLFLSFYFIEPNKQKEWRDKDLKKGIEVPNNYYIKRIKPYSYITLKFANSQEYTAGNGLYEIIYFDRGAKKFAEERNKLMKYKISKNKELGQPIYDDVIFEVSYWLNLVEKDDKVISNNKNLIVETRGSSEGVFTRILHVDYCILYINNNKHILGLKKDIDLTTYKKLFSDYYGGKYEHYFMDELKIEYENFCNEELKKYKNKLEDLPADEKADAIKEIKENKLKPKFLQKYYPRRYFKPFHFVKHLPSDVIKELNKR